MGIGLALLADRIPRGFAQHRKKCGRLDDKSLLFEAKVDGLREICSWILGYGDQVEVLAPSKLRAVIRQMAERMVPLAQETERREPT